MDWPNERYVRFYTRDTTTWKLLPWTARAVLAFLLRKVNRAGVLDVGEDGIDGLAAVIEVPPEVAGPAIEQLIARGVVVKTETAYVMPKFLEAQEAVQSDKQRAREYRERERAKALGIDRPDRPDRPDGGEAVTKRDDRVTKRDGTITKGDGTVTPAFPDQTSRPSRAGSGSGSGSGSRNGNGTAAPLAGGWQPRPGGRAMKLIEELRAKGEDVDAVLLGAFEFAQDHSIPIASEEAWLTKWCRRALKKLGSKNQKRVETPKKPRAKADRSSPPQQPPAIPADWTAPSGEWWLAGGKGRDWFAYDGRTFVGMRSKFALQALRDGDIPHTDGKSFNGSRMLVLGAK